MANGSGPGLAIALGVVGLTGLAGLGVWAATRKPAAPGLAAGGGGGMLGGAQGAVDVSAAGGSGPAVELWRQYARLTLSERVRFNRLLDESEQDFTAETAQQADEAAIAAGINVMNDPVGFQRFIAERYPQGLQG